MSIKCSSKKDIERANKLETSARCKFTSLRTKQYRHGKKVKGRSENKQLRTSNTIPGLRAFQHLVFNPATDMSHHSFPPHLATDNFTDSDAVFLQRFHDDAVNLFDEFQSDKPGIQPIQEDEMQRKSVVHKYRLFCETI